MSKRFLIIALVGLLLTACTSTEPLQLDNSNSETFMETPADSVNNSEQLIKKANQLDLSNQQLTKVPGDVFKKINLEELDLSNNQLTGALQSEIGNLQKLVVLRANNNLMTGVPAEIGQLQNLQILDLSNNQLTGLPNELGNLKNLKTLNISGNDYSTLDLNTIIERLPAGVNIIK